MKTKSIFAILTTIIAIAFCGCGETNNVSIKETDVEINGRTLRTYEINNCEYIGILSAYHSNSDFLTHKGNCKFCEERRKNNCK